MRRLPALLAASLLCAGGGCVPDFQAVACYGPGECAPGTECVARRCVSAHDVEPAADADPADAGLSEPGTAQLREGWAWPELALVSPRLRSISPTEDGGLVLSGQTDQRGFVARFGPGGRLDPTFAGQGWTTWSRDAVGVGNGVVATEGGRVVVAGDSSAGAETRFVVLRFRPDGDLDPTFGDRGEVVVDGLATAPGGQGASAVVVTRAGRLVVFGQAKTTAPTGTPWNLVAVRLRADGTLDRTFGEGGRFVFDDPGGLVATPVRVALDADGASVVATRCESQSGGRVCVFRLSVDGVPDPTFGVGGIGGVVLPEGRASAGSVTPTEDAVYVAGMVMGDGPEPGGLLLRLDAGGRPDADFGDEGVVVEPLGPVLAVAPACGGVEAVVDAGEALAVVRFDAVGRRVSGFGEGGAVRFPLPARALDQVAVPDGPGAWVVGFRSRDGVRVARIDTTCPR